MATGMCLSVIALNELTLCPVKRHRAAEWVKNARPVYILLTRGSLQIQGHTQTEVKPNKEIKNLEQLDFHQTK